MDNDTIDEVYRQVQADASKWEKQWPNHCSACRGWGGSSYQESHGFKGGGSETIFDVCEAQPDMTTCHRCGEHGLSEDGEGPCTFCGWNFDDGVPEFSM